MQDGNNYHEREEKNLMKYEHRIQTNYLCDK